MSKMKIMNEIPERQNKSQNKQSKRGKNGGVVVLRVMYALIYIYSYIVCHWRNLFLLIVCVSGFEKV